MRLNYHIKLLQYPLNLRMILRKTDALFVSVRVCVQTRHSKSCGLTSMNFYRVEISVTFGVIRIPHTV